MQLNYSNLKILKLKIYSSSLSLFSHAFLCLCYLMARFCYLNHSCFFSPYHSQHKMPNFCRWFLWKKTLNWPKIQNGLFLQNSKIVKWGNFVTGIKIFTGNNLINSIVFKWYLPIVNLLSFFPIFMHSRYFFVNYANSVTLFYMVLMLRIWLHRISF